MAQLNLSARAYQCTVAELAGSEGIELFRLTALRYRPKEDIGKAKQLCNLSFQLLDPSANYSNNEIAQSRRQRFHANPFIVFRFIFYSDLMVRINAMGFTQDEE